MKGAVFLGVVHAGREARQIRWALQLRQVPLPRSDLNSFNDQTLWLVAARKHSE